MELVYFVVNASNERIASRGFFDHKRAEREWERLTKNACNENAYYIDTIEVD